MNEALRPLLKNGKNSPSQFAGCWKMDEPEAEAIKNELKKSWKNWKL